MLNATQRAAKAAAAAYFRGFATAANSRKTGAISDNIMGWGIGAKFVDSEVLHRESTVRVYVRELEKAPRIPERFGDLQTDVVAVGQIVAYPRAEIEQREDPIRPSPCGVSVGHPDNGAGTLGCLVENAGNHYILSNNHVLANGNDANIGDPVIQPGPGDGGTYPHDVIATLEPYQEIDFSEDWDNPNRIDAAIALVGDCYQDVVLPEIIEIGLPRATPMTAYPGQIVWKRGRTTRYTVGRIKAVEVSLKVDYGMGQGIRNRYAWFDKQIEVEDFNSVPFSADGDSGSLIVAANTRKPVALLFANSATDKATFANPIDLVLQHYGVTVVGE